MPMAAEKAKKTQHGDAPPEAPAREGGALTADELAGKGDGAVAPGGYLPGEAARQLPVRDGKIASVKRCGWCGKELEFTALACDVCAPGAKPGVMGQTLRGDVPAGTRRIA
jgi:hypothetical protein